MCVVVSVGGAWVWMVVYTEVSMTCKSSMDSLELITAPLQWCRLWLNIGFNDNLYLFRGTKRERNFLVTCRDCCCCRNPNFAVTPVLPNYLSGCQRAKKWRKNLSSVLRDGHKNLTECITLSHYKTKLCYKAKFTILSQTSAPWKYCRSQWGIASLRNQSDLSTKSFFCLVRLLWDIFAFYDFSLQHIIKRS